MSLSSTALSAIQHAGAAVFAADAELKSATRDYAERVNAAMVSNPFGLGNDALFENWKRVARLSQTMAGIEEELKKVYQMAAELTADDGPAVRAVRALAAPARVVEAHAAGGGDLTPTDVRVKPRKRAATPAARAATPQALSGNPAKLLQHLERGLSANEFIEISQTASAQATGIPLGSMTAAIKKLVELGRIIAGPVGSFKLAH